jgi:glycosyltransferase involved in cell wall biosynthesis
VNAPLISCIVPVFNGETYLGEALESIWQQTYRPLEILVVDDGSTDGTAAVAAGYGDRIRYVKQINTGAPTARNLGLSMARGEFVAFLDADDLWHPDKLQRQTARFAARPELQACVTHLQNFWIPELEAERHRFLGHRLSESLPGYVTQTLLARNALFERVGRFDPALRVGDTTDWFLRASEQGTVIELLSDVLVYRRLHEHNMSMEPVSRQMTSSMQDAILRVVKASLDRRRQNQSVPVSLKFPS